MHLGLFIDRFVAKRKCDRWRSILSMHTSKWIGVSVYDIESSQLDISVNALPEQILSKLNLGPDMRKTAVVFALGHGESRVFRASLEAVLLGEEWLLEGVVSINPGKLAVALGHGGEIFLCRSPTV